MYNEYALSPLTSASFIQTDQLCVKEWELASFIQIDCWSGCEDQVIALLTQHQDKRFLVLHTAPDRLVVVSTRHDLFEELSALITQDVGMLTQLSQSRTAFHLSGHQAQTILQKGVAIDFAEPVFPIHSCKQTSISDIGVTLHRLDENTFICYVFRSFAPSFHHWLTRAI
ncbi:sarcosine oxidase subunit gamma [Terasakiella pusilla]|jgi:heterotetrameric sarcosine oxidase gamma subunit|uniref:sarcosine oxidase subunit gamma n=1 Tax=Terasakiella pusilla TaxID=64973 RepID=UPI003AA94F2E